MMYADMFFHIISFQHSCSLHIRIYAWTVTCRVSITCSGWTTCKTSSGTPWSAWLLWLSSSQPIVPLTMVWVIRKTISNIDLTSGIIVPIFWVLKHNQMKSRFASSVIHLVPGARVDPTKPKSGPQSPDPRHHVGSRIANGRSMFLTRVLADPPSNAKRN